MPQITFIDHNKNETTVQATIGNSVMSVATDNGIDGIVAACGGACACATCHCFVDDKWVASVGTPDDLENEMLDCTETERQDGSRLSCQITVTADMDGLVVYIPEEQ